MKSDIGKLKSEVRALRQELKELRQEFRQFAKSMKALPAKPIFQPAKKQEGKGSGGSKFESETVKIAGRYSELSDRSKPGLVY